MALARYEGTAVNTAGDVIPNATVEVRRDQPGRPVVPLWADRDGTVALGNPIQTDAQGGFAFHVLGGVYYIRIYTGPSQQPTFQKVLRYVAIGTAAERDVEDLAAALEAGTATFPTLAALEAFVPVVEGVGGKVTTGADAGFYHYDTVAEEWVFDRYLYDTLARMNVTGGTADAIEAEIATGVPSAAVVMLWIEALADNTGPVTINGKEVLTASGNSLIAGQWNEGRTYWFSDEGTHYQLRTESDVDGIATQVEIWANETLANKNYAEEWAQSDDPISVEAGGDGEDDKSAKTWAGESSASAAAAAGYAAGLNIAPIVPGDAGKLLQVNAEEDGSDWIDPPSTVPPDNSITEAKLAGALTNGIVAVVASLVDLAALNTSRYKVAYLNAGGRSGVFRWESASQIAGMAGAEFTTSSIDDPSNIFTVTAHGLYSGEAIIATASVNNLVAGTVYYVIRVSADTFRLATSYANAVAGTPQFNVSGTAASSFRKLVDPVQGIYVTPTGASKTGTDGAWVRRWSGAINPEWFGAVGDNSTDCTEAFASLFAYIKTLGSSDYGAAIVSVPNGRWKIRPISTDIQGMRMHGVSRLATRFTAMVAAQAHMFHFTNTGANVIMTDFEITGWPTTAELANYPTYGIIFEGGTNELYNYRINRCRSGVWAKRGNYCKFKSAQMGFFDGHAIQLGHIDNGVSGAALSETRIEEIAAYSSAINISGGVSENLGTQFRLSTDNGATVMTRCEGGSTVIGVEIVDGLALGNERATGFLSLVDYNSGKNSAAGLWVKHNGNNLRVINSRFSAEDDPAADGVRLDSENCAAILTNLDCHWCARDGVRITDAISVTIEGGALYELGLADGSVDGIGVDCAAGTAVVSISGLLIDNNLQGTTAREMTYGVFARSGFSGVVDLWETANIRNTTKIAKQAGSSATVRRLTASATTIT